MINYVDFRYSKGKGQTKAGDVFNSALNMGPSDTFYTSDLVDHEIILQAGETADNKQINLAWYPVRLKTVTIEAGNEVAIVDATGHIDGTITGITNFQILPSGIITVSGTPTADLTVTYRFDNESVTSDGPEAAGFTNVPEFELKINTMPVEAKARTLRTYWALRINNCAA